MSNANRTYWDEGVTLLVVFVVLFLAQIVDCIKAIAVAFRDWYASRHSTDRLP